MTAPPINLTPPKSLTPLGRYLIEQAGTIGVIRFHHAETDPVAKRVLANALRTELYRVEQKCGLATGWETL